ncbi:MAG: YdgA family protein [Epsilonproteobacteria bacterium]|nr:YdgA family protein [Campylobacterota bacterium]OIO17511.1 MAG: hypothetical protein AUJ81_01800 [Helicobacteraceae bacterium CG1_02_36_14]PIP10828.1 MAG: hypothetical protein COX50_03815 [Sulfurimonas sp. CG23_combo_of_CG06-09_8_20_14_all_36_33]PIS24703.1 MAG: hypothetical protein COT46_08455 [Sulfurimonas sp. CG08_land_8_20_14_0_20_36_33]PIU34096.1 MAG: hypothetical protein COT05_09135 [Sulfurimonas sp. CG07_land_8_20_14_0_80_36_56]PIV02498.1 MAG: hypothetical protein COS56_11840 [Sulfuri
MKKLLLFLAMIIITVSLLPIMGNKLADKTLNERIEILRANGVELSNSTTDASYFTTKKHYEFLVKDANKLVQYLNQYSDNQLPPYVNALIDGVLIGTDLEYSNFPISDALSVDIYPLSLSTGMMQDLKSEDIKFYRYVKNLLESKGVLYHINYNINNLDFHGYIKDIQEEYVLKDSSKVTLALSNVLYQGNGELIAPKSLSSLIGAIDFNVKKGDEEFTIHMKNFTSSSAFESESTYMSGGKIEQFNFAIKGRAENNLRIEVNDIHLNISSNTQGEKAEFYAKTSLKDLLVETEGSSLKGSDFNYDVSLSEIDKVSLEKLRVLISRSKANASTQSEEEIRNSSIDLLSKGLRLSIADVSLSEIQINQQKQIEGFSFKVKLDVKEDADLQKKLDISPEIVIKNVDMNASLSFSKELFKIINQEIPMVVFANAYAKEVGENIIFDIQLNRGELSVNNQMLR